MDSHGALLMILNLLRIMKDIELSLLKSGCALHAYVR